MPPVNEVMRVVPKNTSFDTCSPVWVFTRIPPKSSYLGSLKPTARFATVQPPIVSTQQAVAASIAQRMLSAKLSVVIARRRTGVSVTNCGGGSGGGGVTDTCTAIGGAIGSI